jgi:hypothetical protein
MTTTAAMDQPAQQPQLDATQQVQQVLQVAVEQHQQQHMQQYEHAEMQQEQQQQQQQHIGAGQQQQQAEQQQEQHAATEEQQQASVQPQPVLEQEQQLPRDVYGFSLAGLTEQQLAARAACDAYDARRRAKWQVYADKQQLPEGALLKRYCRKVRCRAGLHCVE